LHTPAFCRNRIRLQPCSFSHVPALPLLVASTDNVYVASLMLNAAQVRSAKSNAVTLKLISRPPAWRPACRVQVRHANLPDRQLGGACADRLRVNTPIYLHCIQRRSRPHLRFCRCVCANALRVKRQRSYDNGVCWTLPQTSPGASVSWNDQGPSRSVMGLLYLSLTLYILKK
jgi:hypothetical protein